MAAKKPKASIYPPVDWNAVREEKARKLRTRYWLIGGILFLLTCALTAGIILSGGKVSEHDLETQVEYKQLEPTPAPSTKADAGDNSSSGFTTLFSEDSTDSTAALSSLIMTMIPIIIGAHIIFFFFNKV